MIYKLLVDGTNIYMPDNNKTKAIISPSFSSELNSAGSIEFTIPKNHPSYNIPQPLTSTVMLYEDDIFLFYGRISETEIDWRNNKKVYCEGALAFFNDSIQRQRSFPDYSLHQFFRDLIASHNSQMVLNSRKFTVGRITVDDSIVFRETNYETTFECLQRMCLDTNAGYFFIRYENDTLYIDWLKEVPYEGDQPVQFAVNLLDLSQKFDLSNIVNSVIPVGKDDLALNSVFTPVTPQGQENPNVQGWYELTAAGYSKTTDTTVVSGTTYYEKSSNTVYTPVVPKGNENPAANGWYQRDDGTGYKKTTDTAVVSGKEYYVKSTNQVYNVVSPYGDENPKQRGWYVLGSGGGIYKKSSDKTVDPAKTYYVRSGDQNPDYIDTDSFLPAAENPWPVATYGRIQQVVHFNDIDDKDKLRENGQKWIKEQQYARLSIEVEAADLHHVDEQYSAFKVGQMVSVVSSPHGVETRLPLTKMELNLDSGKKQIQIGTPAHKDLTEIKYTGKYATESSDIGE